MNAVKMYVVEHWNGNHSLFRSFFLNGVCLYFVAIALVMLFGQSSFGETQAGIVAILAMFVVGMLWSIIGVVRAAFKALRSRESGFLKRMCAVVFIGVALACTFAMLNDARMLLS
jgi:hypothetical protein